VSPPPHVADRTQVERFRDEIADRHQQLRPQSVAVEGIVVRRFGLQHKLAALGLVAGESPPIPCRELIRSPGFTLAGTFDLRNVQP
jgi:hypothetical protein